MDIFPYPLILADIGGTNARFAVAHGRDTPLTPTIRLPVAGFPSFEAAAGKVLAQAAIRPRSMLVCAAGPIAGSSIRLTNSQWRLEGPRIRTELGLEQGLLLNDFEALALSLPSLEAGDCRPIGPGGGDEFGPRAITGPGTGLGVAALVQVEGRQLGIASEGGHMALAPWDEASARTLACLHKRYGRASAETLISGPGLARLHLCRAEAFGFSEPDAALLDAALVIERCCNAPSSEYGASVKMFWEAVAAFAGDLALCFAATGGVMLAGGMLPRIVALLDESKFRHRFEDKGAMQHLAASIPTGLIHNEDFVLKGMRAIADAPVRFILDYEQRCWSKGKG